MHHKTRKHDLQRDLHQLVDTVAPRVESAVSTVTEAVAEKAPPLIEKGRAVAGEAAHRGKVVATEKGTLLAGKIPDNVVDRLPDRVSDKLPAKRSGRGKKLLLLGILGAVAGVLAMRRSRKSSSTPAPAHAATPPPRPAESGPVSTGPVSTGPTPTTPVAEQGDPSDPLAEPHINGRIN